MTEDQLREIEVYLYAEAPDYEIADVTVAEVRALIAEVRRLQLLLDQARQTIRSY